MRGPAMSLRRWSADGVHVHSELCPPPSFSEQPGKQPEITRNYQPSHASVKTVFITLLALPQARHLTSRAERDRAWPTEGTFPAYRGWKRAKGGERGGESGQTLKKVADLGCISALRKLSRYQRKLGDSEMLSKVSGCPADKTNMETKSPHVPLYRL